MELITREDLEEVLQFWESTSGLDRLLGDDINSLEVFLEKNPKTSFLIRQEEKIIGTVLGGFDGRRGYIYHLGVDPDHRGNGYGAALLERVVAALAEAGAAKIHLYVYQDNQEAIRFYHHLGWQWREELRMMSWNIQPEEEAGQGLEERG
ncbi:MAG: GNAT family N-acetyltransferase [Halanaerobium sp.]|nr:GNAT family N-acetyltransferase [Halanaerobium sp.]